MHTSLEHLAGILGEGELLNHGLFRALDNLVDVDALQVDFLGRQLANLDNVVGLDDSVLGVLSHGLVEVVHGLAELAVTELVGLVDTDQSVVAENRLFQEIVLAVELPDFLGFRVFLDGTIFVVTDGEFTSLDCYCQLRLESAI
jgi:hypothetical protein